MDVKKLITFALVLLSTYAHAQTEQNENSKKIDIVTIASSIPNELFMMYGSRPLQRTNSTFIKNLVNLGKSIKNRNNFDGLTPFYNGSEMDMLVISFQLMPYPFTNSLVAFPNKFESKDMITYYKNHHFDKTFWTNHSNEKSDILEIYTSDRDSTGLRKALLKNKHGYFYGNENAIKLSLEVAQNDKGSLVNNPLFKESLQLIDTEASEFFITYGKNMEYFKNDTIQFL